MRLKQILNSTAITASIVLLLGCANPKIEDKPAATKESMLSFNSLPVSWDEAVPLGNRMLGFSALASNGNDHFLAVVTSLENDDPMTAALNMARAYSKKNTAYTTSHILRPQLKIIKLQCRLILTKMAKVPG